jgi:ubiquinone/menaquinone biosynthesis C-methylase UbiE
MNEAFVFFKEELQQAAKLRNEIPVFLNGAYLKGDNEKYRRMYNWMAAGYDVVETIVGKLKYGNQVNETRRQLMEKLEWNNGLSVLYVSIGTGKDLAFIPESIVANSLQIVGADISIGMLKKCRKKYAGKLKLTLVNCCAEDLPFKDNAFDIVFHVGGINFFNDKKKAIEEMVRVAKPGTKLLIADETNELVEQQFRKGQFSKKYFEQATADPTVIETLVPPTERVTELLWDGKFFCITFRKEQKMA